MATEQDRTPLLPLTPPSRTHQNTIILCDYGGSVLSQRTRRTGAGRETVRMTIDIKATPLLANLNGVEMGKGPSEAIRSIIEDQSLGITATVTPATTTFREKMQRAFDGGGGGREAVSVLRRGAIVSAKSIEQYARERYAGGRTGAIRPGGRSAARVGVDSGRLARGWFVTQNPKEGSWTVNCPSNRFDIKTWGGDMGSLLAWINRYVSLVPALRDPRSILRDERFRAAVKAAPPVVALTRSKMQIWRDWIAAIDQTIGTGRRALEPIAG